MAMKARTPLSLRDYIGVGLVFAFISVLVALLFKNIPQANEQLIVYMLGQLSGFVSTVVAFHYVLNKSSETATENTGKAFDALKAAAESTPPEKQP
ncbi:hypothetical protein [Novosphingobium sp. fls2-241-R2A-195]|uniref:hypothetical protein n=1 Tax=Novosphingobium sp. fls2-241-R2A-195 TaxID=3040296 RepID=UPI00254F4ABE|nr:hypothetical protein [Novosphingobium sp. fls2-241-R2A-195]